MIKSIFNKILLIIGFLMFVSLATAQLVDIPAEPQGYVNDYAHIISSQTQSDISVLLEELKQKTTAEVAVLTLTSTQPETIEQYSVRVFDKWKIGKEGKDNGVLVVVAVNDRQAWITTGYGVEGFLTDAVCGRIVRQIMIPYFKQGDYSAGIKEGVKAVVGKIAAEYNVQVTGADANINQLDSGNFDQSYIFIIVFFVILWLITLRMRNYGGGYWYNNSQSHGGFGGGFSGGFGGGFGGFGGGMTGGGGGGGGW